MNTRSPLSAWDLQGATPTRDPARCRELVADLARPLALLSSPEGPCLSASGRPAADGGLPLLGFAPPLDLRDLGDPSFCRDHGARFPYVAGAMAAGIASVELVEAMARAGMLAFFGAAGLPLEQVARAVDRLQASVGERPHGFNLIHSPNDPQLEAQVAELYLRRGVRTVSASAYLGLTLPIVRYRTAGLRRGPEGAVLAPNRVLAKVSRVEVAAHFAGPPPPELIGELVARGELSAEQAELAKQIPMAQDLSAEADSGGHTDNRPAITLVPTLLELAQRIQREQGYATPLRVGAAGGLGTPQALQAAFAMGAAYVLTGSVNQACLESGTSAAVRRMLADARQADVAMAPAADMFEMGVRVQVLKRGTMFAMRAAKLYELYRQHESLDAIPGPERAQLERRVFQASLEEVWERTRAFFAQRDPAQVTQAEADPKHKLALVCRSYLGQASRWATSGDPQRRVDYQVWCGPAMGAFNEWTRGSFLADPAERDVVGVALNLLYGAGLATRAQQLRLQGAPLPPSWIPRGPFPRAELEARLGL